MAEERDELKVSNSKLLVQLAEVEKEHENVGHFLPLSLALWRYRCAMQCGF
jgi:hypothetical protein